MLGMGMLEALLMLLLPFAFVLTIVWIALRKRGDRLSLQADVRKEIIGKFASGAELREFLKTEEGQAILKPESSHGERSISEKAISRIAVGIIARQKLVAILKRAGLRSEVL